MTSAADILDSVATASSLFASTASGPASTAFRLAAVAARVVAALLRSGLSPEEVEARLKRVPPHGLDDVDADIDEYLGKLPR